MIKRAKRAKRVKTFNSFEDETCKLPRRPVEGGPGIGFQFLWGWNRCLVVTRHQLLPLHFQFLWGWNFILSRPSRFDSILSIPLRMKPNIFFVLKLRFLFIFQFLWGWNTNRNNSYKTNSANFQFLWGWNTNTWGRGAHMPTSSSFNSFEDETDLLLFSLLYSRG